MKKIFKYLSILAVITLFAILATLSFSPKIKQDFDKFTEQAGIKSKPSWVGLYLSGYHAAKNKDYTSASRYFAESSSTREDDNFLEPRTLTLLLVSGKYDKARQVAATLNSNDNSSLANLTIIAGYIHDNDWQRADAEITKIEKTKFNTVIHKLLQAWVKLGEGKAVAAQTIAESIRKQKGLEQLGTYHYALIADMAGNQKIAEKIYDELAANPNTPSSIAAGAYKFYNKIGNSKKASQLLARFTEKERILKYHNINNPKDGAAEAFLSIGGIVMTQYSPDKAASFLQLALYLNDNLDEAKILIGTILINEGDFESSNKILAQIKKDSYLIDYAKLAIARNYESMENPEKAKEVFKDLLNSKISRIEALVSLGDLERKDENWEDATDYYSKALSEATTQEKTNIDGKFWAIYFARGICFERMKNWTKAEADFYSALRLNPDEPEVLNYLGYSWLEMDVRIPEALGIIQKAYKQKPDDSHILDSLGWAYFKMGDSDKAVEYLEDASVQMPYDPVVNDHLGDVYWRLGRRTEAKYAWHRALDNNPEERFVESLKYKIEKGLKISALDQKSN